jgi:glycosyltransferase involved in cell wall biosynthesis
MSISKLLYIGNYRDGTGYSEAAIGYLGALVSAGFDVVARPLKLNNHHYPIPDWVAALEDKSANGCEAAIQHCLPHQMEGCSAYKRNVGLFAWETTSFGDSMWAEHLNLMDEVWVINREQARACLVSGVRRPIKIIPHAVDTAKFQTEYSPIRDLAKLKTKGDFLFYTVGEFNKRKNLSALLRAFHTEFDNYENVQLVIKTSGNHQEVRDYCQSIRMGLKLRRQYKDEIIITDRIDEVSMLRLHSTCDCFVTTSYGEAWSLACMDSVGFGNVPIVPNSTGFSAYVDDEVGFLVETTEEPVYAHTDTFEDLYTSNENWRAPNVREVSRKMRQVYEMRDTPAYLNKRNKCREGARNFSYEAVGSIMKGFLNEPQITSHMARRSG